MSVLLAKQRISVSEPPFFGGELRGNICDSSLARWKADSRLILGLIKHFLLPLTTEILLWRNPPLLKGWVISELNIRLKGYVYRQRIYTVG